MDSLTTDLCSWALTIIIFGLSIFLKSYWPYLGFLGLAFFRLLFPNSIKPLQAGHGKYVVVTGASTGIGYSLAEVFAGAGFNLIIVANNLQRLEKSAASLLTQYPSVKIYPISVDLSQRAGAQQLYDKIKNLDVVGVNTGTIFGLVNNAGIGNHRKFVQAQLKNHMEMVDVNVASLVQLTHLFANDMVKNGSGVIMNVGSTAGCLPGPQMAIYYATKAFVISFSEALHYELRGTGVICSCLCPGATQSEFGQKCGNDVTNLFRFTPVQSSQTVAKQAYAGLMRGDRLIFPGPNYSSALFAKFAPRSIALVVTNFLNNRNIFY